MLFSGAFRSQTLAYFSGRALWVRRLGQRLLNQIQIAVVWGVQVLLYPLYVMAQGTHLVVAHLSNLLLRSSASDQTVRSRLPLEPSTREEDPIQTLLLSLPSLGVEHGITCSAGLWDDSEQDFVSVAAPEKLLSKPIPMPVRGIASLLRNRSLVLVTPSNQVLDCLDPHQQCLLHQHILTIFSEQKPQSQKILSNRVWPLRSIRYSDPLLWRWFCRIMAWVQAGTVARYLNWFQEDQLIPPEASAWDRVSQAPVWNPASLSLQEKLVFCSISSVGGGDDNQGNGGVDTASVAPACQTEEVSDANSVIETEANLLEYVFTPWQRILKGLDQVLFWVEERLKALWAWIQQPGQWF